MFPFGFIPPSTSKKKDEDEDEEDLWVLIFCVKCGCHYLRPERECPTHGRLKDDGTPKDPNRGS